MAFIDLMTDGIMDSCMDLVYISFSGNWVDGAVYIDNSNALQQILSLYILIYCDRIYNKTSRLWFDMRKGLRFFFKLICFIFN
jgi:hypothetical protein